ncbi:hypothetical protein CBS147332_2174 [Penicillium roqueforti]|nr:hypothetical protein CBS147332_2174 [Penicillium roqueforti]KAI3106993.1 hypothetical protein CBS147331_6299 [Penicillium roqueforti]
MSNSGMEAFSVEEDVTEDLYDKAFALNTRAQFFVAQHALKYGSEGGHLILISPPSKVLLAASLADCGPKKMTVNAVALGGILTDMYLENSWYYAPNGYPGMPMEQIDKGIASLPRKRGNGLMAK